VRVRDNAGREGRLIAVGPDETVVIEIDTDSGSDTDDLPREWFGSRIVFLFGWREVADDDQPV